MIKETSCTSSGGEWVRGLTNLTSHCLENLADSIEHEYPTGTDIMAQRLKDPPPSGFDDDQLAASIWKDLKQNYTRLDVADTTLVGLGPNDTVVSWPISPGDLAWAGSIGEKDVVRHFGVCVGGGRVVDLGTAVRAICEPDTCVYWKPSIESSMERVRISTIDSFTGAGTMRCGVYNYHTIRTRMDAVRFALLCVGVLTTRLSRLDAQHIAVYITSTAWLLNTADSAMRRVVFPSYISGTFSRSTVRSYENPGYLAGSSACLMSITDDNMVQFSCNGIVLAYPIIPLAEELMRQRDNIQPYHEPTTGAYLAEDDVANILASATDMV